MKLRIRILSWGLVLTGSYLCLDSAIAASFGGKASTPKGSLGKAPINKSQIASQAEGGSYLVKVGETEIVGKGSVIIAKGPWSGKPMLGEKASLKLPEGSNITGMTHLEKGNIQVTYVGKDGGTHMIHVQAGTVMGRDYAIIERLPEVRTVTGQSMRARRQQLPQ